jgi:hypothetical protein
MRPYHWVPVKHPVDELKCIRADVREMLVERSHAAVLEFIEFLDDFFIAMHLKLLPVFWVA